MTLPTPMLHTACILAQKDLRLFFRDRTAVLLTFLLPLVLGTVFGTAMQGLGGGGDGGGAPKVELALEDRDGSEASRALTSALVGAEGLDVAVVADARRLVANGKKPCGIVIPAGYGAGVAAGRAPDLALLRDPSQAISQQVVLFQLAPVLLQRQVDTLGAGLMGSVLDLVEFPAAGRERADSALRESYARIEAVLAELQVPAEPAIDGGEGSASAMATETAAEGSGFDPLQELPKFLGLVSEDVAGQDSSGVSRKAGASHAFAAMAVMMLLFSVAGAGGTLLQERTEGTLTRLQLTPAAGNAVLLGKLLAVGAIALAQLTLLFTYGAVDFGVPVLDSPVALAVVSLAWAFLAVGIGLTFAVLCSSQKQLDGLSTIVILVMSAVGGAWFPREITPDWFRAVGSVTPVAWAMDAYHGVLWYRKGLVATDGLGSVLPSVGLMVAVGVALGVVSFRAYSRRFARA